MFCHKCGNKIPEGASFCHKCGTALHNEKEEYNVEETAKYDVVLTDLGKDKASAVTLIAEYAELELKETQDLAAKLPKVLKKATTKMEAETIQVAFAEIGARVILKYCKRCGVALEASNYCSACKSATAIITPDTTLQRKYYGAKTPSGVPGAQNHGSVHCPKCKSQKLQTIVESSTESKGGGFSVGKAFLGVLVLGLVGFLLLGLVGLLLFGMVGILCGAFGSKIKITTTNKTFLMCIGCGNKFREAKELAEEKSKTSTLCFIGGPAAIIFGIMMLSDGLSGLFGIVAGGLVIWFGFDEKKGSEEIQNKKYEAEFYKKLKQ